MILKLTAFFKKGKDEIDWDSLGIEPTGEVGFIKDYIFINSSNIESFYTNDQTATNLELVSGKVWSVEESIEEILNKIEQNK